jgi:anti-anti-sigma factor
MRQSVPFIGEELIARDGSEGATATHGKLIDEMLSTQAHTSSWEELVPERSSRTASQPKARAAVAKATPKSNQTMQKTKAAGEQQAHIDWIPINNGHCLRINISGRLDLQLRSEWQRFIRATAASNVGQFEFNLIQTPELSLTGLGLLLLFKEQKKSQRQDIKLCHCNRQIWELLQWTGMDQYFLIQGNPGKETKK